MTWSCVISGLTVAWWPHRCSRVSPSPNGASASSARESCNEQNGVRVQFSLAAPAFGLLGKVDSDPILLLTSLFLFRNPSAAGLGHRDEGRRLLVPAVPRPRRAGAGKRAARQTR